MIPESFLPAEVWAWLGNVGLVIVVGYAVYRWVRR